MHYGLLFEANGYKFDKHWHFDFNVTKCPPWDLKDPNHRREGLFAHVPSVNSLQNQVGMLTLLQGCNKQRDSFVGPLMSQKV
jgi:hypothetical protein